MNTLKFLFLWCSTLVINGLTAQTIIENGQDTIRICAEVPTTISASGGLTYEWSPAAIVDNVNAATVVVTTDMSQNLMVTGTLAAGVSSSDTVFLLIDNREPSLNFPTNTTICTGSSITLNTPENPAGLTYSWTANEDPNFSSTSPNPTVSPTETTTYRVTVNSTCHELTDEITIEVINTPAITISNDTTICAGDQIELSVSSDIAVNEVTWTLPDNSTVMGSTITVNPSEFSNYQVQINYGNNCPPVNESVSVSVEESFELELQAQVDGEAAESSEVIVECDFSLTAVSAATNLSYEWTVNETPLEETTSVFATQVNDIGTFTYRVVATSNNGCTRSAETTIMVREPRSPDQEDLIPNVFTPNGDQLNDNFVPHLEKGITIDEFKIYNRFGQMVYNNENGEMGWDGKFEDQDAPADVYIYQISIRLLDGTLFPETGEVTLLR